jgi:hypothetical protein
MKALYCRNIAIALKIPNARANRCRNLARTPDNNSYFRFARHPARIAHGCAGTSRWNSMIQFVSQVFPPSSEKACCHLAEFGVISDQM